MMQPQDLVVVDMQGHKLAGRRSVSSEIAMHLLIYKMRTEVNVVVHAHPPVATGYAAAGISLNPALVCEAVIGLGGVPLAEYATPGTPELAEALGPLIPQHEATLMANHGVVTYGEDLLQRVHENGLGGTFCQDRTRHQAAGATAVAHHTRTRRAGNSATEITVCRRFGNCDL